MAEVALGHVGIVLAYDATRLARNCSHWYQLLDLCGRVDCLIADRDGVYDPSSINGRLLLGLKGQISELELHTIRARLHAGVLNQARHGELRVVLPTGLVRLETGEVVKHSHQEVQSRLALIFQATLERKTISRVVRMLRDQHLLVPRRDRYGDIQWHQPTTSILGSVLTSPAYAGAFVYGRNPVLRDAETGKTRRKQVPCEDWQICLRDRCPAYVTWESFERIRDMLHDNYSEYRRRQSRGIPRDGQALLQGIVYCGHCGHKMHVQYQGQARYTCQALNRQGAEPVCQTVWADRVDAFALDCFFEAFSVAQIELSASILKEASRQRSVAEPIY